ncbi:MAG: thioesterase family protein [Solirubrobacterales bacterium]
MSAPSTTHRVQMRWRDIDGLGHVNHAVALTYLEEGRDRFLAQHGIARDEYVVGSCTLRFRGEIDPGQDAVTIECRLDQLGNASFSTSERIVSDAGDVVVEAEFGLVLWDRARRASRPLTAEERASMEGVAPSPAEGAEA